MINDSMLVNFSAIKKWNKTDQSELQLLKRAEKNTKITDLSFPKSNDN
jgi:hypothetical protein